MNFFLNVSLARRGGRFLPLVFPFIVMSRRSIVITIRLYFVPDWWECLHFGKLGMWQRGNFLNLNMKWFISRTSLVLFVFEPFLAIPLGLLFNGGCLGRTSIFYFDRLISLIFWNILKKNCKPCFVCRFNKFNVICCI